MSKTNPSILVVEWRPSWHFLPAGLKVHVDGVAIGDVPLRKKRAYVVNAGKRRMKLYAYQFWPVPWRYRTERQIELLPGQYRHFRVSAKHGRSPDKIFDRGPSTGSWISFFVFGILLGIFEFVFEILGLFLFARSQPFEVEEVDSGPVPEETLRQHDTPIV